MHRQDQEPVAICQGSARQSCRRISLPNLHPFFMHRRTLGLLQHPHLSSCRPSTACSEGMHSARMRMTEAAALTPTPSCIARNQVYRRGDALRNTAKGCAVATQRIAAAPALQQAFTARPSPRTAVLQQARAAASEAQQRVTMAAVDDGDLVTPELAWRQFPGDEHYSDKCAHPGNLVV